MTAKKVAEKVEPKVEPKVESDESPELSIDDAFGKLYERVQSETQPGVSRDLALRSLADARASARGLQPNIS